MRTENLKPLCITDFTTEDTIYLQHEVSKGHPQLFLCQFIKYEGNRVYGKVISTDTNPSMYKRQIEDGWELSAHLNKCALYGQSPTQERSYCHWFKASGYAIYPKEYRKESDSADIINEHPSYGMIGISRRSSAGGVVLFGSSIQHQETMTITIQTAEVGRDLNREWYHSKKRLIEVELSQAQFAEFITSPNMGSGVPCTIKAVENTVIPQPPYENRKDLFSKEFANKLKNMSSDAVANVEILKTILSKKSINKGDREEIAKLFEEVVRPFSNTLPFIEKSFSEQMDNTVTEAKAEIEAFVSRKLTEEGKRALFGASGEQKLFIDDGEKES